MSKEEEKRIYAKLLKERVEFEQRKTRKDSFSKNNVQVVRKRFN